MFRNKHLFLLLPLFIACAKPSVDTKADEYLSEQCSSIYVKLITTGGMIEPHTADICCEYNSTKICAIFRKHTEEVDNVE